MNEEDKRFYTYLVLFLILWSFANEVWKSIELTRFHEANNLQLEYDKKHSNTEEKLLKLLDQLEVEIE